MKSILLFKTPKSLAISLLLQLSALSLLSPGSISAEAASPNSLQILPLEQMAYMIPRNQNTQTVWKDKYLSMLSPGGRAYFLANRRDFAKALSELEKLPKGETGSILYVKAFCLDGLGKHGEAVKAYSQAKSKIDLVFDPGAKFFFHYAAALMAVGRSAECLEILNLASVKCSDAGVYLRRPKVMSDTVARRKLAVAEKSGKYKEAIDGYLKLLFAKSAQFRLREPMKADAETQGRATIWLKNHALPPSQSKKEESAMFLLDAGKAYLALGKTESARQCLEKAAAIEPLVRYRIPTETARCESGTPLGKLREQAKLSLARLYYGQKDFPKCCVQLRTMFLVDPLVDSTFWLCSISMRDVPQLVQQKDVDLHSITVEHLLDERLLEVYGPSRTEYRGPDPFRNDRLLKKARMEMEKRSFSACINTLQTFIEENERLCTSKEFYEQPAKTASFMQDYAYRARLLQMAAATAIGKSNQVLSFNGNVPLYKHAGWDAVEDSLLGSHRPKNTKDDRSLSKSDFASLWHFAAALRKMRERDYKASAIEFTNACTNTSRDTDIFVYSRVLKEICQTAAG